MSDLMGRENHNFVVVPRTEVEGKLDWRLPVFEAGRYLVAFDGAALVLLELSHEIIFSQNVQPMGGDRGPDVREMRR